MLQQFITLEKIELDELVVPCCPPPPHPTQPPPAQDPDCCYNSWQHRLNSIGRDLDEVNSELLYVTNHLTVATDRLNRLTAWNTELVTANELAIKICHQLELIDAQLVVICRNTRFSKDGIEILICMVREFFGTVDVLQGKYDRLINCIKCLNNPALTLTQGIGKCLSDFGTALAAVVAIRDVLIQQVMAVYSVAVGLTRQICDGYGYKRLIGIWQKMLGCGIPCEEGTWGIDPAQRGNKPVNMPDPYCMDPMLELPICNEGYVFEINKLYREEKRLVKELTDRQTELIKQKNHLTSIQTGLKNAIKEVQPSVRCS